MKVHSPPPCATAAEPVQFADAARGPEARTPWGIVHGRAGGRPSSQTYATRKSALARETIWRLTPDAFVREAAGEAPPRGWRTFIEILWRVVFPWGGPLDDELWPDVTPYDEITSIRTRFDPTRFDRNRERCDLTDRQGRRVSLFSTRYMGVGDFEDQSKTYAPFVAELTRRVIASRPETPIYEGLSWTAYLLQHGVLLVALLALASILSVAGMPGLGTIWAKIVITLSYAGTMWAYATRNRPRKVNPPQRP